MDTAVFVNGTLRAIHDFPVQVVRLRLLNGSSLRAFNFGFSNGMTFHQIATDGGIIENPIEMNRALLSPGERIEILVDFTLMNGQDFDLMSYASEIPDGIYGAPNVGFNADTILGYSENYLNGTDFELLKLNIVAPTASPVTTVPTSLIPYSPFNPLDANVNRTLVLDTIRMLQMDAPNLATGPFGINGVQFDMDSINIIVPLNSTEIWTIVNKTHIAHPFHIHDIQFNIIERSGIAPPNTEQGWKDVVLVMPHDSVKFLTKFTDFADEMVPYMYHCHLLHHEDDGMMGSFLVLDPNASILDKSNVNSAEMNIYPNPSNTDWNVKVKDLEGEYSLSLITLTGEEIMKQTGITSGDLKIALSCKLINGKSINAGIYILKLQSSTKEYQTKLVKAN